MISAIVALGLVFEADFIIEKTEVSTLCRHFLYGSNAFTTSDIGQFSMSLGFNNVLPEYISGILYAISSLKASAFLAERPNDIVSVGETLPSPIG